MTYFDRDHELRQSALSCIYSALNEATKIVLHAPFKAELQSGKSTTIIAVQRLDEESVIFLTENGELPPMRVETNSLMDFADSQILTNAFSPE